MDNNCRSIKRTDFSVIQYILCTAIMMYIVRWLCPFVFLTPVARIIVGQIPNICLLFADLWMIYSFGLPSLWNAFRTVYQRNKRITVLVIAYLVFDTITLLYAKHPEYSFSKYVDLIQLVFLFMNCIVVFGVNGRNKTLLLIARSIFIASTIVCIVSWVGYYSGIYTMYTGRLSTIIDYNIFSCSLIVGNIMLLYVLDMSESGQSKHLLLYLLIAIVQSGMLSAIILSSSRRTIVYCVPIMIIILTLTIVEAKLNRYKSKPDIKKVLCLSIIVILLTSGSVYIFNQHIFSPDPSNSIIAGTSLEDRYMTIATGSAMAPRALIWSTSVKWIKEMNTYDKVLGGGQSNSFDVFENKDKINSELVKMYRYKYMKHTDDPMWMHPHNLFFTEILQGGIIKLLLVLALFIEAFISVIQILTIDIKLGKYLLCLSLIAVGNLVLGASYGLLGSCMIWLILILIVIGKSYGEEPEESK